jgi:hypothetical protein
MYSRCYSVIVMLAALAFMSQPANATSIAFDGFVQSFPIYADGGSGFNGPWVIGGFNAFAAGYAFNDFSLSFPSLQAGVGGSVSGNAFSQINGTIRNLAQPLGGTVYLSFLIRPDGTLNAGVFNGFFGLTLNGSLGNDLFVGKPGGGSLSQYVLETRGGSGQVPSGAPVNIGHTAFLVAKAQFVTGDDIFTLFVNPKPGQPEPGSGDAVKTDLDLGTVSKIGIYSTGAFTIDEIRIGMTFGDVTPKTGDNQDGGEDD